MAVETRTVFPSRLMGWFRWMIVAVAVTAVVAFVAGAALMGNYASQQQKAQPPGQQQSRPAPADEGVAGDVPGVGDATEKAAKPVVHPLCQGAAKATDVPVLGTVIVFTVDGVSRASGTGGCSA